MKKIIALVFLFFSVSVIGQGLSYVTAPNGLVVREKPVKKSNRIGKLLYGAKVQIIKKTGIKFEVDDDGEKIFGEWVEVQEVNGLEKGFVFSGYLGENRPFTLVDVNIKKLRKRVGFENSSEVIYTYLLYNYSSDGDKFDVKYYDWDKTKTCSFSQKFKTGVEYSVFECKEAGGVIIDLKLPKIDRKQLMNWIEKIYLVSKTDEDNNIWKENNTKFEPKESVPGCYFKIVEKEKFIEVNMYCGC